MAIGNKENTSSNKFELKKKKFKKLNPKYEIGPVRIIWRSGDTYYRNDP